MKTNNYTKPFHSVYANDNDALVPEVWAHESLAILEENMVIGQRVHRSFEDEVAKFGDTVNTRKPGELKGKRKGREAVTIQDASLGNVAVVLNQHVHTSFMIYDGEESMAMQSLITTHLEPAMIGQARFLDRALLGHAIHFANNSYGQLGGVSASTAWPYMTGVRNVLNKNNAFTSGRTLIWTPDGETAALNSELFVAADKLGDDGTALREASMGRKAGFDNFMSQNASSVLEPTPRAGVGRAVNKAGGYGVGATTIVHDTGTNEPALNAFIKIAGDDTLQRVVAINSATSMVISPGLRFPVADDAAITQYAPGAVNLAAGYAAGHTKALLVDGGTYAVGQYVNIGANVAVDPYCIIDVENGGTEITLDRPLDVAVADNAAIYFAPGGEYNFAFHKNALGLIVRPLAMPADGVGARAHIVNHNGFSMRATITYDGREQGHLVTLDMIAGIKVLDTDLGALMYG